MRILFSLCLALLSGSVALGSTQDSAAESFTKTLAHGEKTWTLNNVKVRYSKREGRGGREITTWNSACTAKNRTRMVGEYPNVTLHLSGFDCGSKTETELNYLQLLTTQLQYSAHHIPALPSDPNQFRLVYQRSTGSFFKWKKTNSLNALTRENVATFDFTGEEVSRFGPRDQRHHFFQVTFATTNDKKVELFYIFDNWGSNESVEINVTADLAPGA